MKYQRMFAAAKKDSTLELLCYDVIGQNWDGTGITAKNFSAQIKAAGSFDAIRLRINSPGGDAFEGVAIRNLLLAQGKPVSVFVDGLAASAASIIAMSGDLTMGDGAMLMIHNAWSMGVGSAAELRKVADTLDKVSESIAQTYVTRTGKPLAEVQALMDAETWLSAEDSVREGFASAIAAPDPEVDARAKALRASYDLSAFAKAPAALVAAQQQPKAAANGCLCACSPCADDGNCDGCTHDGCDCTTCGCAQTPEAKASNLSLFEARLRLLHQ